MCLVVELEGVVGVGEVLLRLWFDLCVRWNPVQTFGVVGRVFGVSSLIRLKDFVVSCRVVFFFVIDIQMRSG